MASCVTVTAAKPGHKPDVELMQNAVRNVVECYGLRAFFEEANEEVVVEFKTLHTAKDFSSAFNGQQDAQKGGPSFIALQPVAKGAGALCCRSQYSCLVFRRLPIPLLTATGSSRPCTLHAQSCQS